MQQRPNEWPIWHDDPREDPRLRYALAPLRHDVALARYLEKQRADRDSMVRSFDLRTTIVLIADAWRHFLRRVVARWCANCFSEFEPPISHL
ncbi:hypothetical protein [Mesorhizobium sp. M0220]|uniref:hypothetical protein n=1 Tax=unclassified Mesorhizobium TaxID=325217 RepID=UPI00333925D6